jgi:hypothetical protein
MNKFSYLLNPHAIHVLLYRMKPRKHIHVTYCWQTHFKSIATLSQTFKNHIHNNIVTVKWCVQSASDVFLSKNDNSGGITREASEGVKYDFCPVWWRILIFTHCPIKWIYLWLLIYEVKNHICNNHQYSCNNPILSQKNELYGFIILYTIMVLYYSINKWVFS